MTVRCKFVCKSKKEFIDSTKKSLFDYEFSAVYGDSEENRKFWKYTPSGTLNVMSVQDGQFVIGKEYYLDLIPVESE